MPKSTSVTRNKDYLFYFVEPSVTNQHVIILTPIIYLNNIDIFVLYAPQKNCVRQMSTFSKKNFSDKC